MAGCSVPRLTLFLNALPRGGPRANLLLARLKVNSRAQIIWETGPCIAWAYPTSARRSRSALDMNF